MPPLSQHCGRGYSGDSRVLSPQSPYLLRPLHENTFLSRGHVVLSSDQRQLLPTQQRTPGCCCCCRSRDQRTLRRLEMWGCYVALLQPLRESESCCPSADITHVRATAGRVRVTSAPGNAASHPPHQSKSRCATERSPIKGVADAEVCQLIIACIGQL
ncbi:unnamed protein product [Pleuronectes platessa]|uniref:Uncharacterized protein n=1 Tax=Pleuronectes platessa TaxID=8262 RepID=A0A9N7UWE4_PLEPL|nr:unnamed protein product [Pleuronectes platessa]